MKIIKTATILILLLLAVSVIIYFIPLQSIFGNLPFIKDIYNNTSITINTKNGKSIVKVNGKDYGETPTTINNLTQGDYTVEISRVSNTTDFYKPKEISFYLERGTEAVIDYEIAPGGNNSGYVLYYTKSATSSKNTGFITLSSKPDNIDIYLDNEFFNKSSINTTALNAKNYQLKAVYSGYEELSFPIIIRNGYNLNIDISLFPIPTLLSK